MALRVIEQRTSDLSNAEGAETVVFGWQGANYEIDLTADEAIEFEKTLAQYLDAARRVGRVAAAASKPRKRGSSDAEKIRTWARENGISGVSDRGRISASIRQQYEAAQGK